MPFILLKHLDSLAEHLNIAIFLVEWLIIFRNLAPCDNT